MPVLFFSPEERFLISQTGDVYTHYPIYTYLMALLYSRYVAIFIWNNRCWSISRIEWVKFRNRPKFPIIRIDMYWVCWNSKKIQNEFENMWVLLLQKTQKKILVKLFEFSTYHYYDFHFDHLKVLDSYK